MAKAGDAYIVTLKKSHLEWGIHRYTSTRNPRYGEGYIPIYAKYAREYEVVNSNGTDRQNVLGKNIFNCTSSDGYFEGVVKAQGCRKAGDPYAKQFSGNKNLRALGEWFAMVNAEVGDTVEVRWTSETDIVITKL